MLSQIAPTQSIQCGTGSCNGSQQNAEIHSPAAQCMSTDETIQQVGVHSNCCPCCACNGRGTSIRRSEKCLACCRRLRRSSFHGQQLRADLDIVGQRYLLISRQRHGGQIVMSATLVSFASNGTDTCDQCDVCQHWLSKLQLCSPNTCSNRRAEVPSMWLSHPLAVSLKSLTCQMAYALPTAQ